MDFSRLEKLSNSLNSKSDTLTQAIKSFEAKLASLRLGISAWVSPPLETEIVDPNGPNEDEVTTTLGYSKATGGWCLTVKEDSARFSGLEGAPWPSFTSLTQASRERRIKAIKQLPLLIKEIEKRASEELQVIAEAEQLIREFDQ